MGQDHGNEECWRAAERLVFGLLSIGSLQTGAQLFWRYRADWLKAVALPMLLYVLFRQFVMPPVTGFYYFGNIFIPSLLMLQPHLSLYRLFLGQEHSLPWFRTDWHRQAKFLFVYAVIAIMVFLMGFFVFAIFIGKGPQGLLVQLMAQSCIWIFAFLMTALQFPSIACDQRVSPIHFPKLRLMPVLLVLFMLNFVLPIAISDYRAVVEVSQLARIMRGLADLIYWFTFVYVLAVISALYRAGYIAGKPASPLHAS